MEDWSEDYVASEHWKKYWNAVSAPSNDDESPEGLTKNGDKLFPTDQLLVPKDRARRSLTIGTTPNLCIRAATKCKRDLDWRSLQDTMQY